MRIWVKCKQMTSVNELRTIAWNHVIELCTLAMAVAVEKGVLGFLLINSKFGRRIRKNM